MPPEANHTHMLFSFIILFIIASLTAYYADRKGRSFTVWFILGVLLGIFAPLILFFLPSISETDKDTGEPTMTILHPSADLQNLPKTPPPPFEQSEVAEKLWYYLDKDHQQMGPVSLIALRDLWNTGLLELNSYVWSEGMGQWQKVDDLPALKTALNKE
ncbi:DUF4339 domain-containing protein [Candidatus Protochlamydia phocaeensis]|uniref:DUF4339 domain-containing protein n=1 Tax=Candidatus Protochlamydia phocaeensis TaxID=1414722 RepID=UPI000837C106|nr:DUF4339 domain-containing protein [Candidatus Protochlamydia phocaeensis]